MSDQAIGLFLFAGGSAPWIWALGWMYHKDRQLFTSFVTAFGLLAGLALIILGIAAMTS
jgi:hypothetical protein